jgi:hypothetical protein
MIALVWLLPLSRIDEKILHDSGDRLLISLGDFYASYSGRYWLIVTYNLMQEIHYSDGDWGWELEYQSKVER